MSLAILWFALVGGLGEVALLGAEKFVLHRMLFLSPQVVWMAVVADLALFLVPALLLVLLARRWPVLTSLKAVTLVFSFLVFLGWIFLYPALYLVASLLLAAGLALGSARLVAEHRAGFERLIRRTTLPMTLLVLLLAGGVNGARYWGESRALARLPAAAAGAPNVLLIILDTVRAASLSLYGYGRPTTPELERTASRGVVFDRAISAAPWTLPSHASMFTGRWPHELSANWRHPLDRTHPTLAEVLGADGYATAGFVANAGYASYETGLDRGFSRYEDYLVSPGMIISSCSLGRAITRSHALRRLVGNDENLGRKTAAEVSDEFLSWLSDRPDRPFFAFLNYYDAHGPYMPPEPFARLFAAGKPRGRISPLHRWNDAPDDRDLTPEEVRLEIESYDGALAYLDHELGMLFRQLEQRGLLDNTLVIVAADHGEEFAEHRVFDHGNSLYLPALHVPLMIALPGRVPAGVRVAEPATLRDLSATILDLTGHRHGIQLPGRSLARYWNSGADSPPTPDSEPLLSELRFAPNNPAWFPVSRGDMQSLVRGGFHFILDGDGQQELYDIHTDPLEQDDRAAREEPGTLGAYRRLLDSVKTSESTP